MPDKLDRSVFGYQDPVDNAHDFAQCATCISALKGTTRCYWMGPDDVIKQIGSCVMYGYGKSDDDDDADDQPSSTYTKKELGYVERKVRCEHCRFVDASRDECGLYLHLNRILPHLFALDPKIKPDGCCNAQEPKVAVAAARPPEGADRTLLSDAA